MKRAITFLKTNGLLSLLGLCLAWMIWVQVSVVFVETKEITIDVEVRPESGAEEDRILIHGWDHQQVTVKISGSRRDLDRLNATNLKAVFLARTETLGGSRELLTRRFTLDDLEMPDGIRLLSMTPESVDATIAKYARARVPIRVVTDLTRVPEDAPYELKGVYAIPAQIEIEGPAKLVKELSEAAPRTGGIATLPIQIQNHPPSVRLDAETGEATEIQTDVDITVPLDIEALEKQGLRTLVTGGMSVKEVKVRLRFEHVFRVVDVMVPFDVHWVNPDGKTENPKFLQVTYDTPTARLEKLAGDVWHIPVTLRGPRELLVGDQLEKTKSKLRAFVRADAKRIEQLGDNPSMDVFFEGVREGITVEEIALAARPAADPKPFHPENDGD